MIDDGPSYTYLTSNVGRDRSRAMPPSSSSASAKRVLLTGATGYVGGRLLPLLEAGGYWVRCLTRRPEQLQKRSGSRAEIVRGDMLAPHDVRAALHGVNVAYYLVHAMGAARAFEDEEQRAATIFADAARDAGVGRIIYLGGLGGGSHLSAHLVSRHQVGATLQRSGISTIEFRASIIIGSGSLSFEMIRALVERLPVMIAPRWVQQAAQPIDIDDVLAYLLEALEAPPEVHGVVEIGGADQVSYDWLLREYARQRGLRRFIIPVPVLTPRLSSLWLRLVTPVYARVGRKLVESMRYDTVVTDDRARALFSIRPHGASEAIRHALVNEDQEFAATRWSDTVSSDARSGQRFVDSRVTWVRSGPLDAFQPIERIGGRVGWYFGNWLWHMRGLLDLMSGGTGFRRERRDPNWLAPGDTVDWWRVEAFERGRLLRLSAEMRLPGRAWLQFEVEPDSRGGSSVRQTAIFDPRGVLGRVYWYTLAPIHHVIFAGMLRGIVRAVSRSGQST